MPNLTIRDEPAKVAAPLKALGRRNRRSMEQEV
jgi:hypothetical protein